MPGWGRTCPIIRRITFNWKNVLAVTNRYVPMNQLTITERNKLLEQQKNKCNHCDIEFTSKDVIVQDHHHVTGLKSID